MINADVAVDENNIMTITVDLSKEFGLSKSGKTITIASTKGNKSVPDAEGGEVVVGLNIYKYPE